MATYAERQLSLYHWCVVTLQLNKQPEFTATLDIILMKLLVGWPAPRVAGPLVVHGRMVRRVWCGVAVVKGRQKHTHTKETDVHILSSSI